MSWIPWLWPWVSPEEFSRSALTNPVLTQIVGIRQLWRPTSLHGVHGVLCLYFCVLVTSSSHSLMHWMPLRTWMVPIGGWSLWLIRVGSVPMIPGWCWFQASVAARKCHYTQGASESFQPQSAEKRTIQNHKYSPTLVPRACLPAIALHRPRARAQGWEAARPPEQRGLQDFTRTKTWLNGMYSWFMMAI